MAIVIFELLEVVFWCRFVSQYQDVRLKKSATGLLTFVQKIKKRNHSINAYASSLLTAIR